VISQDIPVGKQHILEFSGLITPAEKAVLLERVETVTRAVKSARARANAQEVDAGANKIAARIFEYILAD
jgi:hypothetical protein